ncbi:MAG TPA: hypothetical protein VHM02_13595 [Thermoanaerobaculia bacterium]|nr:hypothetical protein [Thermoanaerobaculia bacterium]
MSEGSAAGGRGVGDGVAAAREQRSFLERLTARIPGFAGFAERELRRDVDRRQREHLAGAVHELKRRAREAAGAYVDAGQIGLLDRFDRLDRRLDRLGESIRFADYGASGLFDTEKIGAAELQRLYEFDLSLLDDLEALTAKVEELPPPREGDPDAALAAVLDLLAGIEAKWSERETVISRVVQTGR